MSIPLEALSPEREQAIYMQFEDYRSICDSLDRFRKIGLQDKDAYESAIHDGTTIFAEFGDKKIPLFADIAHEKMYETERCHELFGTNKVMLQCVPAGLDVEPVELPPGTGILWEEFEPREGAQFSEQPAYVGNETVGVEFIHPDIPDPLHSRAWMASYSLDFSPNKPSTNNERSLISLKEALRHAWADRRADSGLDNLPSDGATGTFLLFDNDVAARPDIVDELWRISGTGFGKILGAYHPVAMEFNRSFFDEMIAANNSLTAVHYVDGRAACFGFIGLDMNKNDWLNTASLDLRTQVEEAGKNGREYVHFYELISDGERGMGYAMDVLDAFLDIASRSERDFTVFFESTNLSSLYIPDIIRKKIELLPSVKLDRDIEMLDRLHYRGARAL